MNSDENNGLYWDDKGEPISQQFDDRYFCKEQGINESRYVFIEQNNLAERWKNLDKNQFIIGETGFGTGLNFLLCWQLWLENAPNNAVLHFISAERFPLQLKELKQACKLWPELNPLSQQLIENYPPLHACSAKKNNAVEFKRLRFAQGRVQLTLGLGDASQCFRQLLPIINSGPRIASLTCNYDTTPPTKIDAWLLDGFAPAKNPDMWSTELFATINKLSNTHTSFATFTAAGIVRRGLQQAGFSVEKAPGFGRKREMLKGSFICGDNACETPLTTSDARTEPKPQQPKPDPSWHLTAATLSQSTDDKQVIIIGAGISGAHSANALAHRGYKITVLEKNKIASGASGNPQGIVYSKLSHDDDLFARFNLAASHYANQFYLEYSDIRKNNYYDLCGGHSGLIQLALTEKQFQQYKLIATNFKHAPHFVRWLTPTQASDIAKVQIDHHGLFFPQCGWLSPSTLCKSLLQHPNITVLESHEVTKLEKNSNNKQKRSHCWSVHCKTEDELVREFSANKVIVATASDCKNLEQTKHLTVKPIRGQTTALSNNRAVSNLATVLCGDGYIAPAKDDMQTLGATFTLNNSAPNITDEDHQKNLNTAKPLSPDFSSLGIDTVRDGRASFRCTTPDYLPIVGPVAHAEKFIERFAKFRKNSKAVIDQPGPYFDGLYVNLGHGSKGLCYTPICAELLVNLIEGAPLPISRDMYLHLHPARFLARDLARNRI